MDEPDDHIEFIELAGKPRVLVTSKSDKGKWTIDTLKLDSPEMTQLRMKDRMFEAALAELPPEYAELLKQATGRGEEPE